MCADCVTEFEAPHGVEPGEKSRSLRKHGHWNLELILKDWIVFSRAWPVKTRCSGKRFPLALFFLFFCSPESFD